MEQITKGRSGTLDSRKVVFFQRKSASVFHILTVFSLRLSVFFHVRLMREILFCCIAPVVSRSLLECSFGRVTKSSPRAKQTAVAYGRTLQCSAMSEPHSGGDEGLMGM